MKKTVLASILTAAAMMAAQTPATDAPKPADTAKTAKVKKHHKKSSTATPAAQSTTSTTTTPASKK